MKTEVCRHVMFVLFLDAAMILSACATGANDPYRTTPVSESAAEENQAVATTAKQNPAGPAPATSPATEAPEVVPPETVAAESMPAAVEPIETPLVPAESTAYAEGSAQTLALPACYDFDKGASLVPPNPACDFTILPGPDGGTIEVYPVQTAQLAYGGVFPEPPTVAQCVASNAFSSDREIVAPMAAMYVCYKTGEGRTGYLHFTGADLQQAGTVTFDWLTFVREDDDGAPTSVSDLLYRHDTFGFRLALPETWAGYETTEQIFGPGNAPDAGSICFTFAGHGPVCVLKIDVWTRAAWSDLETVPAGYYLAENGQYVFAAGPHQEGCVQLDDFQCERHREIQGILAGFSTE